ncbi:putative fibropellin-1 isoform X4 [Apostichopus japonicus]|uniref:Putative fibropellin-1 isoform X4 n=1 Tax=Stichopus japonicus TaxID=307972 RepID=A0A2G8K4Z6_STIJA|nr:putative fibropellin-1 isoform X4 [Apostichopus japonicus]
MELHVLMTLIGFSAYVRLLMSGARCESERDECSSSPCLNAGTCIDLLGAYRCECPVGYVGINCELDFNECGSAPCLNNATCLDLINGYSCSCAGGFKGLLCETEINECYSSPCQYSSTCVDLIDGFRCDCVPGYHGVYCETDRDECASNPCANGAGCIDNLNGYYCTCLPGYTENIAKKILMNLPTGFEGITCSEEIDECVSFPCRNGGSCNDHLNGYYCTCAEGYSGTTCQEDVAECQGSPCQHSGTCVEKFGSFLCECVIGFQGNVCQTEVNECESNPCLNGGVCTDVIGGYICVCQSGYGGGNCENDIDECKANTTCLNSGTCINTPGGFTCICTEIYTGRQCENFIPVDACWSSPCLNNGTCLVDTPGDKLTYRCECHQGFTGQNCDEDVLECASNPCLNNGQCIEGFNGFECICDFGFSGVVCEPTNVCESSPCMNGATCTDGVDGYICKCVEGFEGETCSINVDDCGINQPCVNGHCVDLINGYTCECDKGFTGVNCSELVDPCSTGPCFDPTDICLSALGSYVCLPATTEPVTTSTTFCRQGTCRNGGTCVEGLNDISCVCHPGFTGHVCETTLRLNPCSSSPCVHGGCKQVQANESDINYECVCDAGYAGIRCHIDLSISQSYLDLTKSPQDVKDFENKLEFLLQEKKLQKRSIRQVDVTITGGEEQTSQQDGAQFYQVSLVVEEDGKPLTYLRLTKNWIGLTRLQIDYVDASNRSSTVFSNPIYTANFGEQQLADVITVQTEPDAVDHLLDDTKPDKTTSLTTFTGESEA